MKILTEKEGFSNIRVLVLFSLVVIMLVALGVSMFAFPAGVSDPTGGMQMNITNITDNSTGDMGGAGLQKMNQTEYLGATAYNVSVAINTTIEGNNLDLWYTTDGTYPDGTNKIDCTSITSKQFYCIIPAGTTSDGNVMAILLRSASTPIATIGTNYTTDLLTAATTDGAVNTWNFTVDGAAPTLSNILSPSSNNTWVTSMAIGFNGTDSTATTLSYKFYINGTANTTGSNLTKTLYIQNASLTALAEGGYYQIILEVADNVSNKLNSSPRTFFYDATAPTRAEIIDIKNGTAVSSATLSINLTDGSGQATINYTIYVNASTNLSNSNGTISTLTSAAINGLQESGYYNISIAAKDNASNVLNVSSTSFYYDTENPTNASIASPAFDNLWITNQTLAVNVSDRVANLQGWQINYSVYVNNSLNVSGTNGTVGQNVGLTGLAEGGYYSLYVVSIDNASNRLNGSTSFTRTFFYDTTAPTNVNITNINTSTRNFSSTGLIQFKAYDGSGQATFNYTIYINGTLNTTMYSNGSNDGTATSVGLNTSQLVNGRQYNITLEVRDNASNALNSSVNTFWYDTTAPSDILITVPVADGWTNSMIVTLNASDTTMNAAGHNLNYTIFVNGTSNVTANNLSASSQNVSTAVTGLAEGGYYNITVRAVDYADNTNETSRLIYYDTTAPTKAYVITPGNNSWTNSLIITINVTDGGGQALNYTVYINGSLNITGSNGSNAGSTNVGLTGLQEGGYYNVTVLAVDNASNKLNDSGGDIINFYYDADVPDTSVIVTPSSNNTWVTSMAIGINGSDGGTIALNYTFYVNGTLNTTGSNLTTSLSVQNASLTGLQEGGYYEIIVEVQDNASNKLNSSPRTLYYDGGGPVITTTMSNTTATSTREVSFYVQDTRIVNQSSITVKSINATNPTGDVSSSFNYSIHCTELGNGSIGYNCSYIEAGLEAGANVINISAKDNSSNVATSLHMQVITSAKYKQNFSLNDGWTLISTPLALETTTISNIVANNSNISMIYFMNNTGTNWLSWNKDGSDSLTTMEPRKGYWVKTTAATTMQFFGNDTQGTPPGRYTYLYLTAGWKTIGHPFYGQDDQNTEDVLSEFGAGTCRQQGTTNSACYITGLYNYSSSQLNLYAATRYNSDAGWDAGRGFLIKTTAAVNWTT